MKLLHWAAIPICLLLAAATIYGVLRIPPWNNRTLQRVHRVIIDRTSYQFHYLDHYTGPLRSWDDQGRLRYQYQMVDGHYDGVWTELDELGAVKRRCTYRQGEPWDGYCQIFERKAWVGEYKQGQPWNGCLPVTNPTTRKSDWLYFKNGEEISEEAFRAASKAPPGAHFVGIHYWEDP